jgi:hypothetical protein
VWFWGGVEAEVRRVKRVRGRRWDSIVMMYGVGIWSQRRDIELEENVKSH